MVVIVVVMVYCSMIMLRWCSYNGMLMMLMSIMYVISVCFS